MLARLRSLAWPRIRGPRRVFGLGGNFGTGGDCGCCSSPIASCPNCNACSGVTVQPDGSTFNMCFGAGGATAVPTFGSVTDSNGTWKIAYTALNASGAAPTTDYGSCTGGAGPHVAGFRSYTSDGIDPCSFSTGNFNYGYSISCNVNGTIRLALLACCFLCGFDGKIYYGPGTGGCPTPGSFAPGPCIFNDQTPTCSGSTLTATFSLATLSGGQSPPGGASPSLSLNLADNGYFCCQVFQVSGCNGSAVQGATATISGITTPTGLSAGIVSNTTNSGGQVTLAWFGACAATYAVTGAPRFAGTGTISTTFTSGATTTVSLSAASGYTCIAGCACPWNNTLHVTFASAGAKALVNSGSGWTTSFSFGGHTYVPTISTAGVYSITQDGIPCTGASLTVTTCPDLAGHSLLGSLDSGSCNAAIGTGTLTE